MNSHPFKTAYCFV